MKHFVSRFPVLTFAALAYSWSWSASAIGMPVWVYATGPLLAALACQWLLGGAAAAATHLRESFRPRMTCAAFLLAVVAPVVILGLAVGIGAWRLGVWPAWRDMGDQTPPAFVGTLLTVAWNGPGEEPGWRGFALPHLLARHSPLTATMLVAALWIPWHFPELAARGEFTPALASAFSLALFCGAVWLTAIYRLSGGSVFACILWHATWNVCATIGRQFTPSVFPWMGAQVALVAVLLLIWRWRDWRNRPPVDPAATVTVR